MLELLIILAIVAAVWQFIPAPQPLKVVGWVIIALVFLLKILLPLLR